MNPLPHDVRLRAAVVSALAAVGVWRAVTVPASLWWRDWILLLGLFSVYTVCRKEFRPSPVVTAGGMAYLLGIYVNGQLPHVLQVLGLAP